MKRLMNLLAAVSSMVALNSCSEQVMNDYIPEGQSMLRVQTRSETPPQQGKVYVFNSSGECVRLLSADEGGQLASTNLVAGSYTVCAVGGEDLSAYTLPEQEEASVSSVISVAEGKAMTDLFLTSSNVTLTAGNVGNLELELDRQVIRLSEVTIKKVPTDVTKVEVSISPLYQGILLNGTPTEEHTSVTVELTKGSDNKTWTNGENQPYCFPSDGNPTVTVSFTRSSGVKRYSYQADAPFEANHQVVMEGTYSQEQDAVLSGTLTTKAWGADKSETFEFDDNNLVNDTPSEDPESPETAAVPVAGETYLGYYVVSVAPGAEEGHGTAVLLSNEQYDNVITAEKMAQKASQISKPEGEGVTCGEWRLPTVEECRIFLGDENVNTWVYKNYYCQDGADRKKINTSRTSEGGIAINEPTICNSYPEDCYYRPVIDITY